ncbi:SPASM domain-containing protein [uncultured Brevundimonas sp.]|uniref:SPASM domain-containing protein n=1 Tax=uncultured Brevundimonas sp. TaxID=213418 RepID=UPI003451AF97
MGDFNNPSLTEMWNGEHAVRVRQILAQGLTPVCLRCVQLYLNRPKAPARDVAYA